MWKCKKCGNYRFNSAEICRCKEFKVIDEDGEDHAIHAMGEEDAALRYAEESNVNNDYYLMNESVVVQVGDTKFRISAEPDVHYSADELTQ